MENSWGCRVFLGSPPLWQEVGRWPFPDTPKAEGAWPQVGTHGRVQRRSGAAKGGGRSFSASLLPRPRSERLLQWRLLCQGATQERKILWEEWEWAEGRQSVVT